MKEQHKKPAVLCKVKSTDQGYFKYRRLDQKAYSIWDVYKPTKQGKSQLPKEFFYFLKREIRRKGDRRLSSLQKAVEGAGQSLGFEVFSEERRDHPRLVVWAAKRSDGTLDAVAAFAVLHGRWKGREGDTEEDTRRKKRMTSSIRHCKAWLRFVIDNSRYPITNLKKRRLKSWRKGRSEIEDRMAHMGSLLEKGRIPPEGTGTMEQLKPTLRFPRLEGITDAVRLREKMLRQIYNRLRSSRGSWRGKRPYDVYKIEHKNLGHHAQIQFLLLAKELLKRKIDPVSYLKVMTQASRHRGNFLPHPSWLASDKALAQYERLRYAQTNRADREEEWQRIRGTFHPQDILRAVEQAGEFVSGAEKNFKMTETEAVIGFIQELNPWFIASYICSASKKSADLVFRLVRMQKELHRDIQDCLKFFMQNKSIWRRVKRALLRILE